ncbi:Hsp20/alpha crystallin family protein [Cytobacillus sp. NCCP-133]|uniref:Hsp20/alpha crystallin family protein n=1 Tax=Cytobacillus sp. NCCP-133 TaxID=766848 RepID=UPI00222F2886|nr:Hsp20 family protein [Cytobacillus sp. NCCP-133]GLB57946.1 molecular chaperone Hsp20 [Cytobacillus sp. NCCP-133]
MEDPKKRERERERERNEPFGDLMKSMNQLFHEKPVKGFLQTMDDFFRNPFPLSSSFHVDVTETDTDHIVTAELPGINKEQIQIDIMDNYVTISVKSAELITEEDENRKVLKRQQSLQRSSRTIPLPQPVNEKKVKAVYKNGLLQITVPKQQGKRILIDES